MKTGVRRVSSAARVFLALVLIPAIAKADNCGSLSDCYGNFKAAAVVGVALVVGAILAFYLWPAIAAGASQAFVALGEARLLASLAAGGGNLALGRYAGLLQRWTNVAGSQKALISEFVGKDVEGLLFRLQNFRVPPGLSRETLQLYGEIARHAIASGKDVIGLQAARLGLIEEALKALGSK